MQNTSPFGKGPHSGGYQDPPPPSGPGGGGMQLAMPSLTPITKKLLILNGGIFAFSFLLWLVFPAAVSDFFFNVLGLETRIWQDWFPVVPVWQLLTHGFLHSMVSPTHILWNMIQLYFFGTMLEGILGSRRFLTTYLAAMVCGALLHLVVETATGNSASVIGASGAVLGIVVATATLRPHARVFVLFIPVSMWLLASVIVAIDVMSALRNLKMGSSDGVAHWVHLGGALWGFATVRLGWIQMDWVERFRARRVAAATKSRLDDDHNMDRLLEKIHREGMNSLTKSERAFLKRVSSRR